MARTVLVIPCYEEARRLSAAALDRALREQPALDLVLVDDGSRDETPALLELLRRAHPERVEVLTLPVNQGKGEAVRRGMLAALARPGVARAGYWDADLSTPLEALPPMEAILDEQPLCELVMGARVKLLGRDIQRRLLRHYMGRCFATLASMTLALPVYDTQCGAKLLRVTERTSALWNEPFFSRWTFDVELLARLGAGLAAQGGPDLSQVVVEWPLERWRHVAGSKLRPRDVLRAARDLWVVRRRYRPGRRGTAPPPPPLGTRPRGQAPGG